MTPDEFVAACRSYLGTPFWHCGRSRAGVDCVGLPVCAAGDCGVSVYDQERYLKDIDGPTLIAGIEQSCQRIPEWQAAPGDILLFKARDGNPQHVAIMTSTTTMIHAWDAVGRVAEHDFNDGWKRQLHAVYRWKEWLAWHK